MPYTSKPIKAYYSLARCDKVRSKLLDEVFLPHYGLNVSGSDYEQLVADVAEVLSPTIDHDILFESMRDIAGVPLTDELLTALAWRLAGSERLLALGMVVPPWTVQQQLEWVPVQVADLVTTSAKFKDKPPRRGADVLLKILAGTSAGLTMRKFWSVGYAHAARQHFGFSKWNRCKMAGKDLHDNFPFVDIHDLYRLRCLALIDPEQCNDGPGFTELGAAEFTRKWNRLLFHRRRRIGYTCPNDYAHACRVCSVGVDQCQAACHKSTYVKRWCNHCSSEAYFDPEHIEDICVNCHEKVNLKARVT